MAPDLAEFLASVRPKVSFHAEPSYNKAGDCLTYFFVDSAYYADRVDDVLTVYRSFDGDAIVGFQIKGVSALVRQFETFGYEYDQDGLRLSFLCYASSVAADDFAYAPSQRQQAYRDILQQVADTRVRLPRNFAMA